MSWTEKLQAILDWINSHSSRLSRKNYAAPNHLARASLNFLADGSLVQSIALDAQGRLPAAVKLDPGKPYRLEVRDAQGEILFTEDPIEVA